MPDSSREQQLSGQPAVTHQDPHPVLQDPHPVWIPDIRTIDRKRINLLEAGANILLQYGPVTNNEEAEGYGYFEVSTDNAVLLAHAILTQVARIRAQVDRLIAAEPETS